MKLRWKLRRLAMALLFLSLSLSGSSVVAQDLPRLEYDSARGVFTLWYWADQDSRARSIEIIPGNRVRPELKLVVERGSPLVYRYTLANRDEPGSSQELDMLWFGCPAPSQITVDETPDGWGANIRRDPDSSGHRCRLFARAFEGPLPPGEFIGAFVLSSEALPDLATGHALGLAPDPPALQGVSETDPPEAELLSIAYGVSPGEGNHDFPVVAPAASPLPADRIDHLGAVRADLGELCELGRIDESRVCNSVKVMLVGAIDALERGDSAAARDKLESFLSELDAQRGKQVTENAYWLLYLHGEDILNRI